MRPEVLILDEPTAGLDPAGREEILSRIRGYHEKLNTTVILVTHSMEEIAKNASRIIVMEDAKVRMTGTAKDIFSHADELESMGLAVPQITQVFLRLRNMGLDVDPSVYTIDQAEREIMEVRRKYDA